MNKTSEIKKIVEYIHIDENNIRFSNIKKIERFLKGARISFQRWDGKKLIQDKQILEFISFYEKQLNKPVEWDYNAQSKASYTAMALLPMEIDLEQEFIFKELNIGKYKELI